MTEQTTEQRFTAAIAAARKAGVKVKRNVQKCCRGCILPSDLGFPKSADDESSVGLDYAYTYGGQGHAIIFRDGEPFNRDTLRRNERRYGYYSSTPEDGARETEAYFNHDGKGGQVIADAMREQGFEVDWDGSEGMCVIVKFPKVGT